MSVTETAAEGFAERAAALPRQVLVVVSTTIAHPEADFAASRAAGRALAPVERHRDVLRVVGEVWG